MHTKFCLCPPSLECLFPLFLWKLCYQIPLCFKIRLPGDSQSLCWVLRLGSLTWASKPLQQWDNFFFFCIIVLQFVDHPPGGNGIWFYHDCAPPTVSLQLLLCLWTWGIFFFFGRFQHPPVNGCLTASCDFGALTGGDECMSFYSTILNQKHLFLICCLSLSWGFPGGTSSQERKGKIALSHVRLL